MAPGEACLPAEAAARQMSATVVRYTPAVDAVQSLLCSVVEGHAAAERVLAAGTVAGPVSLRPVLARSPTGTHLFPEPFLLPASDLEHSTLQRCHASNDRPDQLPRAAKYELRSSLR